MNDFKIHSDRPASRFGEAFPLGNGCLGAMVFGGMKEEKLLISENTFFSGGPSRENNRKGAPDSFYRMREMVSRGQYDEALEESRGFIGLRENYGTNLPVGDLLVSLDISRGSDYRRELDIKEGIASCRFSDNRGNLKRKTWISSAMNCLFHEISAGSPRDVGVDFHSYSEACSLTASKKGFSFKTHALESMHSDGGTGVALTGEVRIITDGTWIPEDRRIRQATQTVICLTAVTDFDKARPMFEQDITTRSHFMDRLNQDMIAREGERHHEEMGELFNRSRLTLESCETGAESIPFLYHYGRYLLYSSSRVNSPLPAHLQGIWNDNVACRIGWTCDMHLDVNTQMNYWPAEVTGLSEVCEPLFSWMENHLVPQGKIAARESYGLPGWAAEIVSNAWGFAAPYWASPIAPCPACGIWILTHLYEHYLYSGDKAFLEERAYPLIFGSVRFFSSYLFSDDKGRVMGGPAISPENSFVAHGSKQYMSHGSTFEILMIRELFGIYLEASKLVDSRFREESLERDVRQKKERLLPYRILEDGSLAEWHHDYPPGDAQHRHTSHLLGLYPFAQITPEETPALARAAEQTLNRKLSPPQEWEDTGWARSMLILYSARLRQGEAAWTHVKAMTEHLLEPNGMIIHPPTRGAPSFDNVYEMDGNTGLTAGIAEMLLQSHKGIIRLLPALPKAWHSGRVTGLRARGGITVSMVWEDSRLIEAEFESLRPVEVVLAIGDREMPLSWEGHIKLDRDSLSNPQ